MHELIFYHRDKCSFCQKVCEYLEKNNIQVYKRDIDKNFEYRNRLQEDAGKMQVPCLMINGDAMFGADNIIQWFKEKFINN